VSQQLNEVVESRRGTCGMPTVAVADKQAIYFIEEKKTTESWNATSKTNAVYSGLLYGPTAVFFVMSFVNINID
jgi:hypothetical protein